jgi:4,5-DOPA dioxygenase extradiol
MTFTVSRWRPYRLQYPAPVAPRLAERAASLLKTKGVQTDIDPGRGFDHGAWTSLMSMHPEEDMPVAQFSIQSHLGPAHHVRLHSSMESGVISMDAYRFN